MQMDLISFEPLKTVDGAPARFDLVNDYFGLSPIGYGEGVKYNLGDNAGWTCLYRFKQCNKWSNILLRCCII